MRNYIKSYYLILLVSTQSGLFALKMAVLQSDYKLFRFLLDQGGDLDCNGGVDLSVVVNMPVDTRRRFQAIIDEFRQEHTGFVMK